MNFKSTRRRALAMLGLGAGGLAVEPKAALAQLRLGAPLGLLAQLRRINPSSVLGVAAPIQFDVLDNLSATTDPGPTNDQSQGYAQGSFWVNTAASRCWFCQSNAVGAATWILDGVIPGVGVEPSSMLTQFGASVASFPEEGNINRQVPGVTNGVSPGGTGADNVIGVYSIPALAFDQAGRGVTITAAGNFAANGNTKTCKLILNPSTAVLGSTVGGSGITIATTGAVTQNAGAWVLMGSMFKRGALGSNTQIAIPGGVILSGTHAGATTAVQEVTATENAPILIAVTGNCNPATDIILSFFEVNAMN